MKKINQFRFLSGFTLVELMMVVAIIAILAAIAIPMYSKYVKRSRTNEAVSNLGAIAMFEETFFSENDSYVTVPPSPSTIPTNRDTGGRRPFTLGGNWPALGRVIPDSQMVYFQYEVIAGQFDSAGADAPAGTWGLASSTTQVTPGRNGATAPTNGTVYCTNLSAISAAGTSDTDLKIPKINSSNWFYATAVADQNGNGACSLFIKVVDRPDIVIENDIE